MDRRTVDVYERSASDYAERRRAYHPDRAQAFAARLPAAGVRLDLGCGPGHYLPHLGRPIVATDAAVGMLIEVQRRHPGVPAVASDIEALPFRPGSLAGVWASKCLQHIPAERVPMVLNQLHQCLSVGGQLDLTVFARTGPETTGTLDEITGDGDDFPGRFFALWHPDALAHVLTGAGFVVDELRIIDDAHRGTLQRMVARATRRRSLADTVGPGMRLLVCGLNPSHYAADAGVGFARPGNRFWAAALATRLVSVDRDALSALRRDGVGMTDLVKRATVAASELGSDEYRAGLKRVEHLVGWLRPGAVCFVGLAGWRAAVDRRAQPGVQSTGLAGVPVYLMPSTSGLNARTSLDDLTDHLRAAAALSGQP